MPRRRALTVITLIGLFAVFTVLPTTAQDNPAPQTTHVVQRGEKSIVFNRPSYRDADGVLQQWITAHVTNQDALGKESVKQIARHQRSLHENEVRF